MSSFLRKKVRNGMRRLKTFWSTRMSDQERWFEITRYDSVVRRSSGSVTSQRMRLVICRFMVFTETQSVPNLLVIVRHRVCHAGIGMMNLRMPSRKKKGNITTTLMMYIKLDSVPTSQYGSRV